MKNKLKQFLELYFAFVKIGAFTFGGCNGAREMIKILI